MGFASKAVTRLYFVRTKSYLAPAAFVRAPANLGVGSFVLVRNRPYKVFPPGKLPLPTPKNPAPLPQNLSPKKGTRAFEIGTFLSEGKRHARPGGQNL